MPIKMEQLHSLGDTRTLAEKSLRKTVKSIRKNFVMKRLHCEFLNEYINSNQMERISAEDSQSVVY